MVGRVDGRHDPARQLQTSRFPPEIIAHAVWLYFRFPLSLRLVEEMLLERGIVVSGGGIEFIRAFAEARYGIPPEQVVGSSIVTKFERRDGRPTLFRLPQVNFMDDGAGKPVGIDQHIGRRLWELRRRSRDAAMDDRVRRTPPWCYCASHGRGA